MNRREFFGCALAGITAALALRFAPFVEWWERWFGKRRRELYEGIDRISITRFAKAMKETYRPDVIWMSPRTFKALKAEFA